MTVTPARMLAVLLASASLAGCAKTVLNVEPVRGRHEYDPTRPAGDPRNDYAVTAEVVSGSAPESLMLEVKPTPAGQSYILPAKRVGEGRYKWVLKGLKTSATMEVVASDRRAEGAIFLAGPEGESMPIRPLRVRTVVTEPPPHPAWTQGRRAARDYVAGERQAYELVVLVMSYDGASAGASGDDCGKFIDGACEALREARGKATAAQLRSALTRAALGKRSFAYYRAVGARCAQAFTARARGETPDPRTSDNPERTLEELTDVVHRKQPVADRLTIKAGFITGCMDAGCSQGDAKALFRAFRAPLQSRWLPPVEAN